MEKIKLYTKEQVINALWATEHPFSDGKNVDEIMKSLTPIELPTDEEIDKKANKFKFELNKTFFKEGAKWVIEQIKEQADGK